MIRKMNWMNLKLNEVSEIHIGKLKIGLTGFRISYIKPSNEFGLIIIDLGITVINWKTIKGISTIRRIG